MSILKLSARNAANKSGRGAVIAIILVAALISGVLNIAASIQQSYIHMLYSTYGTNQAGFYDLTADQLQFLSNRIEFEKTHVVSSLDRQVYLAKDSPKRAPIQSSTPLENNEALKIAEGRAPQDIHEAAVFPHVAEYIGIEPKPGEKFKLFIPLDDHAWAEHEFTVSAVFEASNYAYSQGMMNIWVSEDFFIQYADITDTNMYVNYRNGYNIRETTAKIAEEGGIAADKARVSEAFQKAMLEQPNMYIPALIAVALLAFMGALVIYNIYNMQLTKRTQELGRLAALGASRGQILLCVLAESGMHTLIALPFGLGLGAGFSALLGGAALGPLFPGMDLVTAIEPFAFALSAGLAGLTVLLSVLRPALRVSKISPMEAVRFSGVPETGERGKFYRNVDLRTLAKINLRRNRSRTIVTIVTLSVSGLLFITASSVGDSMLLRSEEVARQEILGDMQIEYLGSDYPPENLLEMVAALPGIDKTHVIYRGHLALDSAPGEDGSWHGISAYGFDDELIEAQLERLGEDAPTLEELKQPNAALLYIYWQDGVDDGQHSYYLRERDSDSAKPVTLQMLGSMDDRTAIKEVRAIYGKYVLTQQALFALVPDSYVDTIAIMVGEEDYDEVEAALERLVAPYPGLNFKSLRGAIEEARQSMLGFIMMIYAIVAVLGLVGFLNLVNSIAVNVEQRKAELITLRMLGASGEDIRRLLWRESAFVAGLCALIACAVGSAAGYLMMTDFQQYTGSAVGFSLPWAQCLALAALYIILPYAVTRRFAARFREQYA